MTVAASLQLAPPAAATLAFANEVGAVDPVRCLGGGTQSGSLAPSNARSVHAPTGIVAYSPEEMIVRVFAGTTVAELDSVLAAKRQHCPLDPLLPSTATVGGVLAVGLSGIRRLRYGHLRDTLLEARYVASDGAVIKAGAPVVKNVSGYDLCKLLVGSWGTLGFLSEVVLRCTPKPEVSCWFASTVCPQILRAHVFRPSSMLWDGTTTFVLLEGRSEEVRAELGRLETCGSVEEVSQPVFPSARRVGIRPSQLSGLPTSSSGDCGFLAEIGVGVVHFSSGAVGLVPSTPVLSAGVIDLNMRIKRAYDPSGRLNPGVQPW